MPKFPAYFFLTILLGLASCAQVVSPSGGERDRQAPQILSIDPAQETTNFTATEISIEFDEFIRLNQLNQQLIVSPPLKYPIETKLKGKKLLITLKDTLKNNSTYVMNFGESIVDITENNPLSNFQYVFSTGNQIDSLSLSGKVLDAFSLEVKEKAIVMLHPDTEADSAFYLELPHYIGRTDQKGDFQLTNIAEGTYSLFALIDANNNYLYDRPDEEIAFKREKINLQENLSAVNLFTFQEISSDKQFIDKEIWKDNQLTLAFKKAVQNLQFSFIDTAATDLILDFRINEKKDSAFFWMKEMKQKKRYQLALSDDSSGLSDTLKLKFDSLSPLKKLKPETNLSKNIPFYRPLQLRFNRPIKAIDTNAIFLWDADSNKIDLSIQIDSVFKNRLHFHFKMNEDSSYFLQILPGAIQDIFDRKLEDTLSQKLKVDQASDYGSLSIKVKGLNPELPMIFQLTNATGKVLRSKITEEISLKFELLKAGIYRIKVILDKNNNGEWDPGNYQQNIQAEKTYIFDENIQIRSNWDKEIDWIIQPLQNENKK